MDISDIQSGELAPPDVRERFFGYDSNFASPPDPVRLRPLVATDIGLLFRWCNLPEVTAYMYRDHEITYQEHREWFQSERDDWVRWVAEADGEPIGFAQITHINRKDGTFEWGDYIADPAARGKGYGKWIKYLLHEHGFDVLGLRKAWCEVFAENQGVWLSHLKFGYRMEGYFLKHVMKGGEAKDVVRVGMLDIEWRAQKARIRDGLR